MSQVAPLPAQESAKLAANQAIIRGRVQEVKRTSDLTYTVIVTPAEDQYSQPATVEVRSKTVIGKPHEDVTVRVKIGGYRRKGGEDRNGDAMYFTTITLTAVDG